MKLPLLVTGFLLRREDTSSPGAIDVDLVAPRWAKADLYLSPIEVAGHSFRTCPSNRHAASWVPLANACEVIGRNANRWNKGLVDACTDGESLSEAKLRLPSGNSTVVHIVDNEENYDADIVPGVAPSIKIGGSVVENFGMGFAKATNASFGIMGLGRDSGLLDQLKKEGNIGAKAFSLSVGSDFKEFQDWDGHPQHESNPGSLVLGGYDFAKQKGDDYLRGPLVGGMPRIQLIGVSMHNQEGAQLLGTEDDALDVEIDSSVPQIYLPPALATKIKNSMEDAVQNNGALALEGELGNITMTIRLPKPGDSPDMRELNITFPESIWHEGNDYIGNPKPSFKASMPIVNCTGSTAIFGRAFLKAVYLAVNYETDEFQIAPASFSAKKNIQAFTSPANGAKSWPTNESKTSDPDGVISPLLIAGVVGGGVLVAVVLGFILRWVRKKKDQVRKDSEDFGYSNQNSDSRSSPQHPKAETTTTESSESYSKLGLPAGIDLGDHSHQTLLISPGFYEYGGYIHSKRPFTKLDATTLTYPTTYTPHKENYTTILEAEVCEPTERVLTPPPSIPHQLADCSPSPPKGTPAPAPNQAAPLPDAPFSPYSPSAVDNLWKKLPQPPHMRVHEMSS